MTYDAISKIIRSAGWRPCRQNGSHVVFKHSDYANSVVVPDHGKKDISIGVVKNIEAITGLSLRR